MNSETALLLQQFIPEARELLEQAGRSLLALEREPDGTEPMNALFRAVHTLKGTSGLFAIEPLTRLVHAGEDLLCAVQSGHVALAPDLADALLESLDQVGAWIDSLAEHGELPASAQAASEQWVVRLRAPLAKGDRGSSLAASTSGAPAGVVPDWAADLADGFPSGSGGAVLLAIRYAPDRHCFFRGEDPIGLMRQVPGLRHLRVEAVEPWPTLDNLDPFACTLCLRAVAAASEPEAAHLFRYISDQVEIVALPPGWPAAASIGAASPGAAPPGTASPGTASPGTASAGIDPVVAALLDGHRRLLRAPGPQAGQAGRLAAAVRGLRGILAFADRTALAAGLEHASEQSLSGADPRALLAFVDLLASSLAGPATTAGPNAAAPSGGGVPVLEARADTRAAARPGVVAPATLRVDQGKIDTLMNLIGELVVAKNSLAYLARRAEQGSMTVRELSREIKERHGLVNRIAEDMQGAVMSVRMLPVEHVFQRFPRLVRDIAKRLGKRVELVVEGGDTEADKNIIEAVADPLIHMVRNSLDHGIELPEQRVRDGKPEHGTLRLHAEQDNDNVLIRVVDDGRGIDAALVRRKAVEKGLIDAERAAALPDDEAVNLVFAPGFSTSAEVSDLSGRGVGMDVVRRAVEKVGGRVSLSSRPGQGTTVDLVLPLSMAVTRIMTVCCGERMFGVPMALVVETVRVRRTALHRFRDREAFVLRDSVVPVVRLAELLDLPGEPEAAEEEAILVVRLHGQRLGVVVGAFREGMEVIVKPMDGVLADLRGFAGTTLLGDGRVLLVLDLRELVT